MYGFGKLNVTSDARENGMNRIKAYLNSVRLFAADNARGSNSAAD